MSSRQNPRTIPPCLHDNLQCGFAAIYQSSENAATVQDWIRQAYLRKSTKQLDHFRVSLGRNRAGEEWIE